MSITELLDLEPAEVKIAGETYYRVHDDLYTNDDGSWGVVASGYEAIEEYIKREEHFHNKGISLDAKENIIGLRFAI